MSDLNAIEMGLFRAATEACDKCAVLFSHLKKNTGGTADWPIQIGTDTEEDARELAKLMTEAQNALRNAGFEIK